MTTDAYMAAFEEGRRREIDAAHAAFNWRMEGDDRPILSDVDALVSLAMSLRVRLKDREAELARSERMVASTLQDLQDVRRMLTSEHGRWQATVRRLRADLISAQAAAGKAG